MKDRAPTARTLALWARFWKLLALRKYHAAYEVLDDLEKE